MAIAWGVVVVVLIALIALAVFILPRVMVTGLEDAGERLAAENDIRSTLLQSLTGLFFLTTAFFTWRQLRVARTRLTTERFTRAIDQLGHESIDVRLGGIYSLEQIVREEPNTYHNTIIEVLSAYLRSNAPLPDATKDLDEEDELRVPSVDIQAVVTVLGRRRRRDDEPIINLASTDLFGVEMKNADFKDGRFDGVDLRRASITNVDLKNAFLMNADLRRALLFGIDLGFADLGGADLREVFLGEVDFTRIFHDDSTKWPDGFTPPPSTPRYQKDDAGDFHAR